jgi:hypothetical protein
MEVAFGWSVGDDSGGFEASSWGFRSKFPPAQEPVILPLPPVEEPHGLLYAEPSDTEKTTNERIERLLADNLLVFAHRVLFGQCRDALRAVRYSGNPVDVLLVFGPTLPKLIGRLCYTHLSRAKTIAVVASDVRLGSTPNQGSSWDRQPMPGYWEDSAVRRWRAIGGADTSSAEPRRRLTFDIIIPVGDAIVSPAGQEGPSAIQVWNSKAERVKAILSAPGSVARVVSMRGVDVHVPRGVAAAAREALVHWPALRAQKQVESIDADANSRELMQALRAQIAIKTPSRPPHLEVMILALAYGRRGGHPSAGAHRQAAGRAKAARSPKGIQEQAAGMVSAAIEELRAEYGHVGFPWQRTE